MNKRANKRELGVDFKFPFRDNMMAPTLAVQKDSHIKSSFDPTKLPGLERKRRKDPWFELNAKKLKEGDETDESVANVASSSSTPPTTTNSNPEPKLSTSTSTPLLIPTPTTSATTTTTATIIQGYSEEVVSSSVEFSVMKEKCELKVAELLKEIEAIKHLLHEKRASNSQALSSILSSMAADIDGLVESVVDQPEHEVNDKSPTENETSPTTSPPPFSTQTQSPNPFFDPLHFEDPFNHITINHNNAKEENNVIANPFKLEELFQSDNNDCLIGL